MRKGEANPIVERVKKLTERRQESIVTKCHPAIFDLAQLYRDHRQAVAALGPNPPAELIGEIQGRTDKQLSEIYRKHSGSTSPAPNTFAAQIIFSEAALASESDAQGIAEALHFERHRTPLKVDRGKSQARDWEATQRILRTISDLQQLRCGRGPIQPFKGDPEHSGIFEALWGFGIEKLTPEELAIFFDSYCPCGSDAHDSDALKKQRARFQKILTIAQQGERPKDHH